MSEYQQRSVWQVYMLSVESASTCLYFCLSVFAFVCLPVSAFVCLPVSVSVECEFPTDAEVGGAEGGGRPPSLWEEQSNGSVKKTFSKKNQLH